MRDKPTVIVTARKPRPRTLAKPAAASPMPARIVTARKARLEAVHHPAPSHASPLTGNIRAGDDWRRRLAFDHPAALIGYSQSYFSG
jgi:hypothetical protein